MLDNISGYLDIWARHPLPFTFLFMQDFPSWLFIILGGVIRNFLVLAVCATAIIFILVRRSGATKRTYWALAGFSLGLLSAFVGPVFGGLTQFWIMRNASPENIAYASLTLNAILSLAQASIYLCFLFAVLPPKPKETP
jgi:hypothetical protein